MIGHLILTEIDAAQPAPFSYRIVTELLREELGFQGVVITDGLQMKALTDSYTSGEIARRAVSAGVDILLCPSNPQAAVSAERHTRSHPQGPEPPCHPYPAFQRNLDFRSCLDSRYR